LRKLVKSLPAGKPKARRPVLAGSPSVPCRALNNRVAAGISHWLLCAGWRQGRLEMGV